jgi:hypothetical protein
MSGVMERPGAAQRARIGDVEDLAAVGVVLGTSVWPSETLLEVGCRATKAMSQADRGLGIASGAEDYVLQERRAVDRWREIAGGSQGNRTPKLPPLSAQGEQYPTNREHDPENGLIFQPSNDGALRLNG